MTDEPLRPDFAENGLDAAVGFGNGVAISIIIWALLALAFLAAGEITL
jgi:hypothetical protein